MPVSVYYRGHGEKVMRGMKKKYGKRAKEVFYATANEKGMKPGGKMPHKKRKGGLDSMRHK